MYRLVVLYSVLALALSTGPTSAFTTPIAAATLAPPTTKAGAAVVDPSPAVVSLQPKDVVTRVAVAGATGRTGRLVVEELLARGIPNVVALTRDETYAAEVFPNPPKNLLLTECDLSNDRQLKQALDGVDAVIWCATGFSSRNQKETLLDKALDFLGMAKETQPIDIVALPKIAKEIKTFNDRQPKMTTTAEGLPKVVMLSSAGVTRTIWDEEKKALLPGAADIPIVRLNPFGALDIKRESEDTLRESGVDYVVVRPCGLNDKHPAGSRPLFSQGDVAVGRINSKDVAKLLVDCLASTEATGKTFEVISIAGYQPAASVDASLASLRSDKDGLPPMDAILSTYTTLQQLLPGETQDSAALAMGQTYEQKDKNEEGRLGARGEEDARAAAPKPSS